VRGPQGVGVSIDRFGDRALEHFCEDVLK